MDIEILFNGKITEYSEVTDLELNDDGWIEFNCINILRKVFRLDKTIEHIKTKGEITKYIRSD